MLRYNLAHSGTSRTPAARLSRNELEALVTRTTHTDIPAVRAGALAEVTGAPGEQPAYHGMGLRSSSFSSSAPTDLRASMMIGANASTHLQPRARVITLLSDLGAGALRRREGGYKAQDRAFRQVQSSAGMRRVTVQRGRCHGSNKQSQPRARGVNADVAGAGTRAAHKMTPSRGTSMKRGRTRRRWPRRRRRWCRC